MKTRHFLNSVDHDKIVAAIAKAEKGTTGEICVFVSRHDVANGGDQFWNEVVEAMRHRLKRGEFTDALLDGIERVGSLLADHFPAVHGAVKRPSRGVVEE